MKNKIELSMTVDELLVLLVFRCEKMKNEPNNIERKRRLSDLEAVVNRLKEIFDI